MFESVVFPAPFSPSSACTSPSAASKSTPSFATTRGNRFVIPRSTTAGAGEEEVGGEAVTSPPGGLTLGAADHALDEPAHRVQLLDRQANALPDAQLALLVVQGARELVEPLAEQRGLLRRDRLLRLRLHLRPVRREADELVVQVPVVEVRLPFAVHR